MSRTGLRTAVAAVVALLAACGGDGGGDGSAVGGSATRDIFDESALTTYEIGMDPGQWEDMVAHLEEEDRWWRCTVTWEGETYPDVGIKPAGQSSRKPGIANPEKPSVWLSFKEFVPGREFHKHERIKLDGMLDDPAVVRERLAYGIYRARGVPAPRVAHSRVVVNGHYRGLYLAEERVNKEFATKRWGNPHNQLYRWTERAHDVDWRGDNPRYYVPNMWEPRIESVPDNAVDVQNLVDVLNNAPDTAESIFDVETFLNFMAVEVATGETDGYIGGPGPDGVIYTGNIFLYRKPTDGRFTFIVWDRDQAFWDDHDDAITENFDRRILTNNLILRNPARLELYRRILREIVDGPAHPDVLGPQFEAVVAQIKDAAYQDPYRKLSPTTQQLEWEWDDVRRRIPAKHAALRSQLAP